MVQKKQKHVPERTCIGCRSVKPKKELIRLVKLESGEIEIDITGKMKGRGTYLCNKIKCQEAGLKKKRIETTLHTKVSDENINGLIERLRSLMTEISDN